jgi:3-phosphoshikimate 1-carboxyvinyltransferase
MTVSDSITLTKSGPLRGEFTPPPDKSITHRAIIFSSIANGTSHIGNLLKADDPMRTFNAMKALGVRIEEHNDAMTVYGKGIDGLQESEDVIDCGNSGTTMRLLAGLLSGFPFFSVLTGDSSLRKRPMKRIITPLRMMGARLSGRHDDSLPPLSIKGGNLKGIRYQSPVASAQVKSAILLAGMYAGGDTIVEEPHRSRDHTERILSSMGAQLKVDGMTISLVNGHELSPFEMTIPGDFSSAAFFMIAAAIMDGSELFIKNVGVNPTRRGLLKIMQRMGADIQLANEREVSGEPVANLLCRFREGLKAIDIGTEDIPSMIDEFPIVTVLATQAEGTTTIRGAEELRVKESDRIAAMATELKKMGVEVEEYPDGLSIEGNVKLRGAALESHGDHRVAMALSIASLIAEGDTAISGVSAVDISFPGFFSLLRSLSSA